VAAPETLPLSAPPVPQIRVEFEIARAGRSETRIAEVAEGTLLRVALRSVGLAGEGSAVLDGERPVPLDTPLSRAHRLTVVPTFSGG
jgi:sulfur carrier protein ThiS